MPKPKPKTRGPLAPECPVCLRENWCKIFRGHVRDTTETTEFIIFCNSCHYEISLEDLTALAELIVTIEGRK